ncbi:MAG: sensor histidine kinase [Acidimicrobiales bacterium]
MTRRTSFAIVAVGLAVAVAVAVSGGTPARDLVALMGLAVAGSVVASLAGMVALRRLRHRPLRDQAIAIALSAMGATIVGVVASAAGMFISTHDLRALIVVLVVSGSVAVGAAVQLGNDLGAGTRQVGDLARRLGDGDGVHVADVRPPGELGGLAAELEDVSRRLDESRRRERALEGSRRELIAWVSHDLRSPLATIRAMAEALDDGVVDDAATTGRYHHQIRTDAERLTALVDDLFELSRINSGTLRLHRERVPLADLVGGVLTGAHALAHLKGIELDVRTGELPAVDVAPHELGRVLHNLLDNAIRHTPTGGHVVVESTAVGSEATLTVTDECGGIPETDIDRVFDVAFRGDSARGKDNRGGGLGLAIARGLVEAHDGCIEVANEPSGCRFTVRLPVA